MSNIQATCWFPTPRHDQAAQQTTHTHSTCQRRNRRWRQWLFLQLLPLRRCDVKPLCHFQSSFVVLALCSHFTSASGIWFMTSLHDPLLLGCPSLPIESWLVSEASSSHPAGRPPSCPPSCPPPPAPQTAGCVTVASSSSSKKITSVKRDDETDSFVPATATMCCLDFNLSVREIQELCLLLILT